MKSYTPLGFRHSNVDDAQSTRVMRRRGGTAPQRSAIREHAGPRIVDQDVDDR